ncbi:MAG: serine/threonine protein kinase [Lentisphaeraceae bacterium]|nr:serine/threonine protein kinase [Lentisphaeraceae bacterium]
MKSLFSGLFGSKKDETCVESSSLSDLMSFMENKVFPCSECGHFVQLDKPEPLTMSACSKCGHENFIPQKVGPFLLYKFCGDGGMGRVYKATCSLVPGVEYAVKILPKEMRGHQELEDALKHEAELTLLFNDHPNSVNVVECDVDGDIAYLVTELVEGLTLEEMIKSQKRLSEKEVVRLVYQLLLIIEFIYSKGYLYRDLKPQNIVVNGAGQLVLMDYGICLPKGTAAHPNEMEADGSPHFIPPERITDQGEDIRSEIYSIGMLLYFMLSGETYFSGETNQEIAEQHVQGQRKENLSAELSHVSSDLVDLIDRMTKVKKRKRVQTLGEVQSVIKYLGMKYDLFEKEQDSSRSVVKL